VGTVFCLTEVILGSPDDDLFLVLKVIVQHLLQGKGPWFPVNKGNHDGAKGLLQLGVLKEPVQEDIGVGAS